MAIGLRSIHWQFICWWLDADCFVFPLERFHNEFGRRTRYYDLATIQLDRGGSDNDHLDLLVLGFVYDAPEHGGEGWDDSKVISAV
jgi:hypothetical protein